MLSHDVEAEKAVMLIDAFQKCGAAAVFMPHATPEEQTAETETFTPVQKQPDISFDSPPADEAAPVAIRKKPKKNGSRRFILILVILLFCLSLAYLTWQLWPDVGAKFDEIINFLKRNI